MFFLFHTYFSTFVVIYYIQKTIFAFTFFFFITEQANNANTWFTVISFKINRGKLHTTKMWQAIARPFAYLRSLIIRNEIRNEKLMPRNRKRKRRKRKYIALQLILMILIKPRARARASVKSFANWKTRLNLKEIPRESFLSRTGVSHRWSFVLRLFCRRTTPSCLSYEIRGCLRCVTAVTQRAKFSHRRSRERGGRNARKMPGIEDVERRDASHSIIISLPAFPKDCTTLARIQSNAIGD